MIGKDFIDILHVKDTLKHEMDVPFQYLRDSALNELRFSKLVSKDNIIWPLEFALQAFSSKQGYSGNQPPRVCLQVPSLPRKMLPLKETWLWIQCLVNYSYGQHFYIYEAKTAIEYFGDFVRFYFLSILLINPKNSSKPFHIK